MFRKQIFSRKILVTYKEITFIVSLLIVSIFWTLVNVDGWNVLKLKVFGKYFIGVFDFINSTYDRSWHCLFSILNNINSIFDKLKLVLNQWVETTKILSDSNYLLIIIHHSINLPCITRSHNLFIHIFRKSFNIVLIELSIFLYQGKTKAIRILESCDIFLVLEPYIFQKWV